MLQPSSEPICLRDTVLPASASLGHWLAYFQENQAALMPIPWDDPYQLAAEELATIQHSIQMFQLGESSEGTHLMRLARHYADQTGDRTWVQTIKLFIGEEQRHARDLGRFMTSQGIGCTQKHWTDDLFRKVRRMANLEVALRVLLTAELVATLYYPALGRVTRSPILQQLCRQIAHDEQQHVQFQGEAIAQLRHRYPRGFAPLIDSLHRLFFYVTLLVVWVDHRPVLHHAGYTWTHFCRCACNELNRILQLSESPA